MKEQTPGVGEFKLWPSILSPIRNGVVDILENTSPDKVLLTAPPVKATESLENRMHRGAVTSMNCCCKFGRYSTASRRLEELLNRIVASTETERQKQTILFRNGVVITEQDRARLQPNFVR